MSNYVCGFVFDEALEHVALVVKRRPDWQRGLLNGIGGAMNAGERRPRDTMAREFTEETGLSIHESNWTMFAEMLDPVKKVRVAYFYAVTNSVSGIMTVTDEPVGLYLVHDIAGRAAVPDVQWLVPLALQMIQDKETRVQPYEIDHVVVLAKK